MNIIMSSNKYAALHDKQNSTLTNTRKAAKYASLYAKLIKSQYINSTKFSNNTKKRLKTINNNYKNKYNMQNGTKKWKTNTNRANYWKKKYNALLEQNAEVMNVVENNVHGVSTNNEPLEKKILKRYVAEKEPKSVANFPEKSTENLILNEGRSPSEKHYQQYTQGL